MESSGGIVQTFRLCLKLIDQLGLSMANDFFSGIWKDAADDFFDDFVDFLKSNLTDQKSRNYVAQSLGRLNSQISGLLKLVAIFRYMGFGQLLTSLSLEKTLLILRSKLLSEDVKLKGPAIRRQSKLVANELNKVKVVNSPRRAKKMTLLQEWVIGYLRENRQIETDQVQAKFGNLSGRTIRRNIGKLVGNGLLRKVVRDKRVFYELAG